MRKYYKYIDTPWTQPVLSANGTVGGNDFACFASSIYSTSYPAYEAFDGVISSSSWWCSSGKSGVQYIGFYNPDRIKVTNIRFYNQTANSGDGVIASGTVQASFDNVNYIDLGTFSGNTFGTVYFDIDLSTNTNYYNYYRIVATGYAGNYATCGELEITATIGTVVEGTEQDYDFYTESPYVEMKDDSQIEYKFKNEYTTPGTYTINIAYEGDYEIEMYGAGGGVAGHVYTPWRAGYNVYTTVSGGSGAGFKGVVHLPHGAYTITVGAYGVMGTFSSGSPNQGGNGGATSLGNIISTGGGTGGSIIGGSASGSGTRTAGVGGTVSISDASYIVSADLNASGNDGIVAAVSGLSGYIANCPGGLSLYDNSQTGYGAGGGKIESNPAYNAQNGYFKINRTNPTSDIIDGIPNFDYMEKVYDLKTVPSTTSNYYSMTLSEWTQPVLSSNGTIGGDSFAVAASSEYSTSYQAWRMFNGSISSGYYQSISEPTTWIMFYNPKPLNVTAITITNYGSSYQFTTGSVEGSSDGVNWTYLTTISNSSISNATWFINLGDNKNAYNYYRIVHNKTSNTATILYSMQIAAKEATISEIQNPVYEGTKYYKYDTSDTWTQPILAEDGTMGGNNFAVGASTEYSTSYALAKAFNGSTSSGYWQSVQEATSWAIISNPNPLCIKSIVVTNYGSSYPFTTGYIEASNNLIDWTKLLDINNPTYTANWTIDLSANKDYYKYYKLVHTKTGNAYTILYSIQITSAIEAIGATEVLDPTWEIKYYKNVPDYENPIGNYTPVGSLTYNKGVISGFSSSSYANITTESGITNIYNKTREEVYKITTGSNISSAQCLRHFMTSDGNGEYIYISNSTFAYQTRNQGSQPSSVYGSITLSANTDYWVKFVATSDNTITLSHSTDGINYIQDLTYTCTVSANIVTSVFGCDKNGNSPRKIFGGSIDLIESYIKIDNSTVWQGVNYPLVPEEVLDPQTETKYYKHGDLEYNVTEVGTLTKNNGVVNGFSTSNYAKVPNSSTTINASSNIEWVVKIKVQNITNSYQTVFGGGQSISGAPQVMVHTNYIRWAKVGEDGTNTKVVTLDEDVYLKLTANSGTYTLYTSSDGEVWTNQGTKSITSCTFETLLGCNGASNYFRGSIDLNESYIKINGEYWWRGTTISEIELTKISDNEYIYVDPTTGTTETTDHYDLIREVPNWDYTEEITNFDYSVETYNYSYYTTRNWNSTIKL